jgi:NADH dehydrogenase FAD-containing subunit
VIWLTIKTLLALADKLFTKVGTFKEGQVVSIEKTNDESGVVHLASGESVPYDILVLSPGSIWEGPLNLPTTKPEIDAHLAEWRARFKDAKGIVIAGGGAVGVGMCCSRASPRRHYAYAGHSQNWLVKSRMSTPRSP